MRARSTLVLVVLLLLPLAGCLTPPGALEDQSETSTGREEQTRIITGNVGGSESKTEKVTVPADATRFVVDAMWNVGGSATFTLYDPAGNRVESAAMSGGHNRGGGTWYETSDPMPGDWALKIATSGGVNYQFTFTF